MTTHTWLVASLVCLTAPTVTLAEGQAAFYVAPDGKDSNPGTEALPFATIEKFKQAVRAINKDTTGDIVVVLRGGTYRIERTITFDAAHSGTGGHNVIYRAAPNEIPIINGGRQITGWQSDEKGAMEPEPQGNMQRARQLFRTQSGRGRADCREGRSGIEVSRLVETTIRGECCAEHTGHRRRNHVV